LSFIIMFAQYQEMTKPNQRINLAMDFQLMRKALIDMSRVVELVDGAHFVATLWCLSPLIPVSLLASEEVVWMPYAGACIFALFGYSVCKLRSKRKRESRWGYSDAVAYIVLPLTLFGLSSYGMFSSAVT
jgi:hypothetical protein